MKTLLYLLLSGPLIVVFAGCIYMLYTLFVLTKKHKPEKIEKKNDDIVTPRSMYRVRVQNNNPIGQSVFLKEENSLMESTPLNNLSEMEYTGIKIEIPQYVYNMANGSGRVIEFVERLKESDKETKFMLRDNQQRSVAK